MAETVSDWRPIETADKDSGKDVLLYSPEQGMAVWPAGAWWPHVTHWMPLPEPPRNTLQGGDDGRE